MTVERLAVEAVNWPDCDVQRAIADLGLSGTQRGWLVRRLTKMPSQWAPDQWGGSPGLEPKRPSDFTEWAAKFYFNEESAVWLLSLAQGSELRPYSDLSAAEKKQAFRLWRALWMPNPAAAAPQLKGRPPVIDYALILYIMLILEKACGRRFTISRRSATDSTAPGTLSGPMWHALFAALHFANGQSYRHPEAVARAVRKLRSNAFRERCSLFGLVLDPRSVAVNPTDFRIVASSIRMPD